LLSDLRSTEALPERSLAGREPGEAAQPRAAIRASIAAIAATAGAGFLAGAAVGGALLGVEVLALVVAARGELWPGSYPWLAWALGLAVGGLGGAGLAAGTNRPGGRSPASHAAERSVFPLLAAGVATLAAAHANHWLLPALGSAESMVASGAILGGALLAYHRLAAGLRTRAARWLGGWRRLLAAAALSAVPAAALALLAPVPPRLAAIAPWVPPPASRPAWESDRPPAARLMVLGIDGAGWAVLEPQLEAGRLPHLAALVARGRRGVLRNPDVERDLSPTAWTTLFSGVSPARHGITRWTSPATSRRAKALWNLLDERALRALVVNVPGTYPAEALRHGALLAGEPAAESLAGTALGFWFSTAAKRPPDGPGGARLDPRVLAGRPARAVLRSTHGPLWLFAHSSPGLAAWALGARSAPGVRRLLEAAAPALGALEVAPGSSPEGPWRLRIEGSAGSFDLSLPAGGWGPWLEAKTAADPLRFRLRGQPAGGGRFDLAVSPLVRQPVPGLSGRRDLLPWLEREGEPYLAGGDAPCAGTRDPWLAALCEEGLLAWERRRAEAARALLDALPWDALVHVFTATDRAQHLFWGDGAIARVYEEVDRRLGELLARAGPETLVVVASDHGAQGGPARHHPDGIYLLAGPTVPPRGPGDPRLGPALEQVDLLPVLLAHLGLPAAADLPGRVPEALWPRGAGGLRLALPAPVASFGIRSAAAGEATLEPAALERLRTLGYAE
jgi:hypothetical protein